MKTLILFSLFLLSLPLMAAGAKGNLAIQPIIGLERVQKFSPTVHTKERTIVGVRLLYGPPMFSFEAEGTTANDTESFAQEDLTIKEESYAAKLGLRSSFNLMVLRWYLRAGGHARKNKRTKTQAGVTTIEEPAIRVSPYAGTGFSFNVMGNIFANGGVTVIFSGKPKGSDREYQTTFGVGVRI